LKHLVAYITSAYPDKAFSLDLAASLAQNGVDALELGIPFSDPVADGPVIEEANHIALQNGFRFADTLEISKTISETIDTLWMGYFNSFYQFGIERLLQTAKELHVSGLIIPDLPHEETLAYSDLFNANGIANISFVAPTDSKERIKTVVENAKKFIYMVAYTGITGSGISEDLRPFIADIKESTDTPVYVGFGVNAKTAKEKAKDADGVIVGSAFINILLNDSLTHSKKIQECGTLASIIKNEINA
jgi:tryptophan synthase alpha chain